MNKIKKLIKIQLMLIVLIAVSAPAAMADLVIPKSGEVISCKIKYIMGDVVLAKDNDGDMRFIRNTNKYKVRDFVEIGFFKRKRLSGQIQFMDGDSLDLKTHKGVTTIPRYKVRNIILTQD